MDNTVLQIQAAGQSVWIDTISRGMLITGELGTFVHSGVTGLTSNPTIFEKAVSSGTEYDAALAELASEGLAPTEVFERLAIEDIQGAADVLRSVYDHTEGRDGYVSLEVPPSIAHDTQATVSEARRLWAALKRPNVMIKVPATPEGIPAVRTLIADGINVNVTLIFALSAYSDVMEAYLKGIEDLIAAGKNPARVASVASFFISRVDTAVDTLLRERAAAGAAGADGLVGTAAVANARAAYAMFEERFGGERFAALAGKGARVQRPLWASTSTKDPAYPDTLYVDTLIGPDTVNTMPPQTLDAVLDHGDAANVLAGTGAEATAQLEALRGAGIDLDRVTDRLLTEGVAAFAASFDAVIASVAAKCDDLARTASS